MEEFCADLRIRILKDSSLILANMKLNSRRKLRRCYDNSRIFTPSYMILCTPVQQRNVTWPDMTFWRACQLEEETLEKVEGYIGFELFMKKSWTILFSSPSFGRENACQIHIAGTKKSLSWFASEYKAVVLLVDICFVINMRVKVAVFS